MLRRISLTPIVFWTSGAFLIRTRVLQWLSGKEFTSNAGDTGDVGLIPALGRSPGRGHGNPLQYSCLENPMNRGAWRATVQGSQRVGQKRVTKHTHT